MKTTFWSLFPLQVSDYINFEYTARNFLDHFDSKGKVEDYIMEKAGSMTWNSVRIAGYFNNFLTFWKPKKLDDGSYVLDLAMEGKPMYGMDVEDFGECVASKIII